MMGTRLEVLRKTSEHGLDARLESGACIVVRRVSDQGFWEQAAEQVYSQSLAPAQDMTLPPVVDGLLEELRSLSDAFSSVRFRYSEESREVQTPGGNHKHVSRWLYWELQDRRDHLSVRIPVAGGLSAADAIAATAGVQAQIKSLREYQQLPTGGELKFDCVLFAPQAFGGLVHEAVGHRLEEDVFSEFIPLNAALNFDVFDGPGDVDLAGHTPFDDVGKQGALVKILDGTTGRQCVLGAATGSLRAINYRWHPIPRQRCLEIRPLRRFDNCLEDYADVLVVEAIRHGRLEHPSRVVLETSRQHLLKGAEKLRMPKMRIAFDPSLLPKLLPFGEGEWIHPGGGCHKDLQRGLAVSQFSCSAILPYSSADSIPGLRIWSLDE